MGTSKHSVIADLIMELPEIVGFDTHESREDITEPVEMFHLRRDLWEDMGSPETITVTVVAGDQLNDPSLVKDGSLVPHDSDGNELSE